MVKPYILEALHFKNLFTMENNNSVKTNKHIWFAIVAFCVLVSLFTYLLFFKYLSGIEYIGCLAIAVVTAFIIALLEKIDEISLGGNVIKLRETNEEAKGLIKEMKVSLFRLMIKNDLTYDGFFGNSNILVIDEATKFLKTFHEIKKESSQVDELKDEILSATASLIDKQLEAIRQFMSPSIDINQKFGQRPKPNEIRSALNDNVIAENTHPSLAYLKLDSLHNAKVQCDIAIKQYEQLLKIQEEAQTRG